MKTPLEYAEQICYSSKATLYFTSEMSRKMKDRTGVFVECGVAAGAQIIAMKYGAPDKMVYAFDSYEGIPMPSNRDDQMPGIKFLSEWEQKALPDPGKQALVTSGATVVPLEHVKDHIYNSGVTVDNIEYVVGWFEETVPKFKKRILFLRLDGDLYNSTWVCLQHLFEQVVPNGLVVIDDWTLPGCRAACDEYFALIGYSPDYKYLDGTAYFFK